MRARLLKHLPQLEVREENVTMKLFRESLTSMPQYLAKQLYGWIHKNRINMHSYNRIPLDYGGFLYSSDVYHFDIVPSVGRTIFHVTYCYV